MVTIKSAEKDKQGFASMEEDRQKEIASKWGKTSYKNDPPGESTEDEDEGEGGEGESEGPKS